MNLKFYEKTINLIDSNKTTRISDYAPLLLKVDPFNIRPNLEQSEESGQFQLSSKVYKIVYDWGDGKIETQKIFPSEYTDNPVVVYPSTKEKGDPRNFPKQHLYTVLNENRKSFFIKIDVYLFGELKPLSYRFEVIVEAPRLDGTLTGFFKNFHLIYTKMFGVDNKILYVFEGKNPSWIFPVIADWRPRITSSTGTIEDYYYTYQLNI